MALLASSLAIFPCLKLRCLSEKSQKNIFSQPFIFFLKSGPDTLHVVLFLPPRSSASKSQEKEEVRPWSVLCTALLELKTINP